MLILYHDGVEPRADLIKAMSLLKRNALAAPFEKAFALQKHLEANPPAEDAVAVKQELMSVHYRFVTSPLSFQTLPFLDRSFRN